MTLTINNQTGNPLSYLGGLVTVPANGATTVPSQYVFLAAQDAGLVNDCLKANVTLSDGVQTYGVTFATSYLNSIVVGCGATMGLSGGVAPLFSALSGGIYQATSPSLSDGQMSALQLGSDGSLVVEVENFPSSLGVTNLPVTVDANYGTVGASTVRTAAQVGNATGGADFGPGVATSQTLRVALSEDHGYGAVGAATARTAAQIGNASGGADFGSANYSAQTLLVVVASNQPAIAVTPPHLSDSTDSVSVTQSTNPWLTRDNSDGATYGGVAATLSSLAGGVYNTSPPAMANGQQAALQLDNYGRLITSPSTSLLVEDHGYGTVGTGTLRTASQIGNSNGAADFGNGGYDNQTLRVVVANNQPAIAVSQSGTWTVQPGNTPNTTPWLVTVSTALPAGSATIGAVTQASGPWTQNLTQVGGSALSLGQAAMAASVPVAIASNQTALPASQSGTWTVQPGNTANTTPWLATVATALPAGANTIGAVTQASGPWTQNLTQVGGASISLGHAAMSASLPVAIASDQSAIPASQSGTWTVQQGSGPWTQNLTEVGGATLSLGQAQPSSSVPVVTQADLLPATQSITAQDSASTSSAYANGQQAVTGTPTAGSAATFSLSSYSSVAVQVTGTWTGTLQVESSMDGGTTWFAKTIKQSGVQYEASSFTSNFQGGDSLAAMTSFRVRSTAAWTGTATVRVAASVNQKAVEVSNSLTLRDATTQSLSNAIKGSGSAAATADNSLVVAVSPNSPLPAGTNDIGSVGQFGTWTVQQGSAPWTMNLTQVGGSTLSLGQQAMANSVPVALASNQSSIPVTGTLTNNNAAPSANNVGALVAMAESSVSASRYSSGDQVLLVTDLAGNANVDIQYYLGAAVSKTNPIATTISDGTNVITAAISAYGVAPTGTEVMGVNAYITNTPAISNLPATVDTNYGAAGASTIRTAAQVGNSTGAASFGAGATGAQTLRVAANTYDGAGNAVTSTATGAKQALDVVVNAPSKSTYLAGVKSFSPPATPTDMITVTGSATKTVKILRITLYTTQTTAGTNSFFLVRRSAANTGGTTATTTANPLDTNSANATAVVKNYTANATSLGSSAGTLDVPFITTGGLGAALQPFVWDFSNNQGQPLTLRGASDILAINFNGAALPIGLTVAASVLFTEE